MVTQCRKIIYYVQIRVKPFFHIFHKLFTTSIYNLVILPNPSKYYQKANYREHKKEPFFPMMQSISFTIRCTTISRRIPNILFALFASCLSGKSNLLFCPFIYKHIICCRLDRNLYISVLPCLSRSNTGILTNYHIPFFIHRYRFRIN